MYSLQIGHHGTHHTTRKATLQQQRGHVFIGRIHEIAQEVIYKFLCHGTCLHICLHIDIGHLKALIFQHGLYGNHVRMYFTPGHRFHSHINDVGAILANFQNRSHRQPRSAMAVILDNHFGMPFLNCLRQPSQHPRTTDACHIFQTDFGCSRFNQLVGNMGIIFHRMHRRVCDTKGCLRYHPCLQCIFNRRNYIPRLVQSTEDAGDIHPLRMLHTIHQTAYIGRHRIHAQSVQTTVQHMRLYTHFIERFGKSAYGFVRILTVQQIHLLKSSPVRFHTGKTPHFNNQRSDTYQLIYTGLIFTGRLPHITVNKTEFNFLFHRSQELAV